MSNKINPSKGGHNGEPSYPRPAEPPKGQGDYQPNRSNLDTNNPPQGGSGIPRKKQ